MIPTVHPLSKTATELRRSINRLMIFRQQNALDDSVVDGSIDATIKELKEAYLHLPADYRKADLDGIAQ